MPSHRFYTLDAMRGIAAVAVVCLHASQQLGSKEPYYSYLAVDYFFMLSGFVIARNYEAGLRQSVSFFSFLRSRLIRLYPIYIFGALLGVAALSILIQCGDPLAPHPKGLLFAAGLSLLLLPDPVSLSLFPVNPPSWSLFFEIAVNVLFARVLFRLSSRCLAATCIFFGLVLAYYVAKQGSVSFGSQWSDFFPGVFRTIYGFTFGMLVARRLEYMFASTINVGSFFYCWL